ncbi:MAG: hypothetical protein V3R96_02445 [Dehalococcoidales bacterium]
MPQFLPEQADDKPTLEAKRYIDEIKKLDLPEEDIDNLPGNNAARLPCI